LQQIARTDGKASARGEAWFWLSQLAVPGIEAQITQALSQERARAMREKLVFALSQLPQERATSALIALLKQPALPKSVRQQALFWLAQSQSSSAQIFLDQVLQ
jgi:hypothetical protein